MRTTREYTLRYKINLLRCDILNLCVARRIMSLLPRGFHTNMCCPAPILAARTRAGHWVCMQYKMQCVREVKGGCPKQMYSVKLHLTHPTVGGEQFH